MPDFQSRIDLCREQMLFKFVKGFYYMIENLIQNQRWMIALSKIYSKLSIKLETNINSRQMLNLFLSESLTTNQ